ncbi:polyphosphate polymerase domain-containing protein [Candidatus Saccharibacteria bacterium]|nr:polyphosphate polymerase domain-containing protein [Candidatus Saccharibacteria bacterium]
MATQVFRRTEIKYIITENQFKKLMDMIEPYLEKDKYFKGTNMSIYYDDENRYLAIHSLEKPLYKEKIRLRSYGVPTLNDTVFLEIKKKFKGVGSKRRIPVKLKDFYSYEKTGELETNNENIKQELDECFDRYKLKPTMFLAYDRTSYCDKDDPTFRVTFDRNVRSRNDDLRLERGDQGTKFFNNNEIVMEVKSVRAYPFYFVRALSKLKIYPASFSKYGRVTEKVIYQNHAPSRKSRSELRENVVK